MKSRSLLMAIAIYGCTLSSGWTAPLNYNFFQIDPHRFVEGFPHQNPDGSVTVSVKVSNGGAKSRGNPLHLRASFIFIGADGKEIARVSGHVWAEGTFLGGGKDKTFTFNVPAPGLWSASASSRIVAGMEPPSGNPTPDVKISGTWTF
jgi:hypothetical protein